MSIGEYTQEQNQFRELVRRFVAEKFPESEVRRLMETEEGYDPKVWAQAAEQLGLQGIAIPEEYDGSGSGWIELGIILEEFGKALVTLPFFSTVVFGATTLLESGDDQAKEKYLPGIASGETIATLALVEDSSRWDEEGVQLTAEKSGDGWALTGTKPYVLDGHVANLILVAARTPKGVSIFAVDGDASGLTRTPLKTLDLTRKYAKIEFAGTPAELIGTEGEGWKVLSRVLDFAAVGLAAEQAGGARAALDMAVDYMKVRVQFGQLIGSFQALKHMAADVLVEVESAKSAADYAVWAAAEDNEEFPAAASLAQSYNTDAFVFAAHQNIQFHGGMGFTWEMGPHLYFKRARGSELLLGDAFYHREILAQRIGV